MLKIGIVGAGVMGNRHQGRVADYGAQVVAVHDVHLSAAQELGTKAGAKTATDDLKRFFDAEMDGLIITTPPPVRVEPVSGACERGIHLMIEKPPALNMAEGRACLAHIEEAGVIAAVSFQLRYASIYERLKELLTGETVHLVHTACMVNYYLNFRMSPWFLQRQISGGPSPSKRFISSIVPALSWATPSRFRHTQSVPRIWHWIEPSLTLKTPSR